MSGLLRNLIAFCVGLLAYARNTTAQVTMARFWVTPFDAGLKVLKSDQYLQFAETAQLDYLLKTGQFFPVLWSGASFVNVAQLVKFLRPIPVFSVVRVETQLVYANEKCAYFSHVLFAKGQRAAEVLVKMKFKKGRLTVPPEAFLPLPFTAVPASVQAWESALEVL